MASSGLEPATFWFVAECLNHYATACRFVENVILMVRLNFWRDWSEQKRLWVSEAARVGSFVGKGSDRRSELRADIWHSDWALQCSRESETHSPTVRKSWRSEAAQGLRWKWQRGAQTCLIYGVVWAASSRRITQQGKVRRKINGELKGFRRSRSAEWRVE
jgi:hypothetical protein